MDFARDVNALPVLMQFAKHGSVAVLQGKAQIVAAGLPKRFNAQHRSRVESEDRFVGNAAESRLIPAGIGAKRKVIRGEPLATHGNLRNDGADIGTTGECLCGNSQTKQIIDWHG